MSAPPPPGRFRRDTAPIEAPDRRSPRPMRRRRWIWWSLCAVILVAAAAGGGVAYALDRIGRTPREWAPYIVRRAEGHRASIVFAANLAAGYLNAVDSMDVQDVAPPAWAGAQVSRPPLPLPPIPPRQHHLVGTVQELRDAIAQAQPGDLIELLPGTYEVRYPAINVTAAGTAAAPITLRSPRLGDAIINGNNTEIIKVFGPYWHFENIEMHGICADDTDCDNAIHVVGGAQHFVLRNSRILDFNAQIKINTEEDHYPDYGLLEYDTLSDTHARATGNPVTPVDMVAASNWRLANNLITDFVKLGGDQISYGAFAKGGGDHNIFERNAALCNFRLRGNPGQTVGLSFGGGGTGPEYFRNNDNAHGEQTASLMRDNLVAFCSADAVYLNRAAQSRLDHNTFLDTSGVEARFPETSAEMESNIIDGVTRARDGATLHETSDLDSPLLGLFLGWHPQRQRFVDIGWLDLRWRVAPPATSIAASDVDFCGMQRHDTARPGAFDDFTSCLRMQPKR